MELLRRDMMKIDGGEIPVELYGTPKENNFEVRIDGLPFAKPTSKMHAVVLHTMVLEHIQEYITFKSYKPHFRTK